MIVDQWLEHNASFPKYLFDYISKINTHVLTKTCFITRKGRGLR